MRKRLYFIFFSLCSIIFAETKGSLRLVICTPEEDCLKKEETLYICSAVQDNLEANFSLYTGYQLVDLKNQQKIIGLQKKSVVEPFFDERTIIEAGKLGFAEYALFTKIKKIDSFYSLVCDFTNLTTGEKDTVISSNYLDVFDLMNKPGCAVNEISVKLFELLKVEISDYQRQELMQDIESLSEKEKEKQARENQRFYEQRIERIEKEILSIRNLETDTSNDEQIRLEAIKVLNEEKLKINKRLLERIQEQEKRKAEEEKKDLLRSKEQKRQRNELIRKIDEAENQLRNLRHDVFSPSQEIDLIESKKKILCEIRSNADDMCLSVKQSYQDEYNRLIEELEKKPFRDIEMINGKPSTAALENREKTKTELLEDFNLKTNEEINNIRQSIRKQDEYLLSEIKHDYKQLQKLRVVDSFSKYMNVTYSEYDPDKKGWTVKLLLEDNYISFVVSFWLAFDDVSVLIQNKKQTDSYESYLDKVEILDSCFQRGEQVLLYTLKYKVVPSPDDYPSQYQIIGKSVDIKDMVSKRMLKQLACSSSVIEINRSPAYKILEIQNPLKSKKYEVIGPEEKEQENVERTKLIEIKVNIDFEENLRNTYVPFNTVELCFGDDDSFISYFDILALPIRYGRFGLRLGIGHDDPYSINSYAFGVEAFLPLTNWFSVYGQGNWSLSSYVNKKKYYHEFHVETSGLYFIGIRLATGENSFGVNANIGYGVELRRDIHKERDLPKRKVFCVGIGFGEIYKDLWP